MLADGYGVACLSRAIPIGQRRLGETTAAAGNGLWG
jgi:hypothetical protein